MIDALIAGGDDYRGIAIVKPDISHDELAMMDVQGVRGVRFNFVKRLKARQSEENQKQIIEKIAKFSWHTVVYFEPEDLSEIKNFLKQLETPVIIDHMGRVPVEKGVNSPEFEELADLLRDDKFWVKVTCPERLSKQGPPYSDVDEVSKELIRLVPDRVLWGTDWPHPNMKSHIPDDGLLVDRLVTICPDIVQQQKMLIDNPNKLYWNR